MGFFKQLGRDITYLRTLINLGRKLNPYIEDPTLTAADLVEKWAAATPDKEALVFEGRSYTYAQYNAEGEKYAQWALAQGLEKDDVVALLMGNRPEYLFAWLGMAKVGIITALINTNLTGNALAHCVNIAGAKHMILGAEMASNYESGKEHFEHRVPVWLQVAKEDTDPARVEGANDLNSSLAAQPDTSVGRDARAGLVGKDVCFFIYTSGTTGLPKAARFVHTRVVAGAGSFSLSIETKASDRVYIPLPLYHSSGGVAAVGIALFAGATIILVRKFSVTRFWSDCVKYDATMFQYIGELCRYLLNADPHPDEQKHVVRGCVGNGLRPEIWEAFQKRFNIPRIVEFYGATEGNIILFNFDGHTGAVGRITPLARKAAYDHIKIVKFDVETEDPVRDEDGFCIESDVGETGEMIGRISEEAGRSFDGYGDKSANAKKLLHDVFSPGDVYFRTGDLLKIDKRGYLYFMDRIGDTFRWKGENVATSEVSEALSIYDGVKEANVYGVKVPGADGRAGMAAIVAGPDVSTSDLGEHIKTELPAYARPMFLRLLPEMEITGTFKHRKVELVKDGFDPASIEDPLFFFDDVAGIYVPLTGELFEKISGGSMRL